MRAAPRSRLLDTGLVALALAGVLWFFAWTANAANAFGDWGEWDYYRLLVRGFRKGHLFLDRTPPPGLLALNDPYDPAQNGPYRLPDASYYRGHYYLYFGPAPAVMLMWPVTLVSGREMTTGIAVFAFSTIAFLTASGLWLALRRRYFPNSAAWVGAAGVLGLGASTHLLALLRRPMWWELAVAAGIAFCLLALVAVYRAIHGRRPLAAMAFAGACIGLAAASRATCVLAAPLLLAPVWLAWRKRDAPRPWWKLALAGLAPLVACGFALLAYNYARFENPFEFGQRYQLSGAYESKLQHFSGRYVLHNLAIVFFQPLRWTWTFPFVDTWESRTDIPGYFGSEQLAGLVMTFPFLCFVPAVPLAWRTRNTEATVGLRVTLSAVGLYFAPVCLLLMCYFATTPRYMADFASPLALLAACGLLGLERWSQSRAWLRWLTGGVACGFVAVTVGFGVLLSFDYHGRAPQRENPDAWRRHARIGEDALGRFALLAGQIDGPRVLKVRFAQRPKGTMETFWEADDARAGERIVLEHTGEQLIRFGYARAASAIEWGRPLRWETDHTHTVELQLPSLYGARDRLMSSMRAAAEFRERSSVAVWFSGGRALTLLVEPLAAGFRAGGRVSRGFSGDVRGESRRLFREDETGFEASVDATAPAGGALALKIRLPDRLAPDGEPLFAAGAMYASDVVFVRDEPDGAMRFVVERFGSAPLMSAPLALDRSRDHEIEIGLPSCRADAFGMGGVGEVVIRVNGVVVLQGRHDGHSFPPGTESIGRNPFGTTCGPEFRGWILEARWRSGAR